MSTIMSREAAKQWWGINPPKHVLYYYKDDYSLFIKNKQPKWEEYTYEDLKKEKKRKQNNSILMKRLTEKILPAIIILSPSDNYEEGYTITVATIKNKWYLYSGLKESVLFSQIRNIYPFGLLPFEENRREWFKAFDKKYRRPDKKKAIAFCHIRIDKYHNLKEVLK